MKRYERPFRTKNVMLTVALMGAPMTGKSTFLNQLQMGLGEGWTVDAVRQRTMKQVLTSVSTLIHRMPSLGYELRKPGSDKNAELLKGVLSNFLAMEQKGNVDAFEIHTAEGQALVELCKDLGLRACADSGRLASTENTLWWCESMERLLESNFVPSRQDLVRLYIESNEETERTQINWVGNHERPPHQVTFISFAKEVTEQRRQMILYLDKYLSLVYFVSLPGYMEETRRRWQGDGMPVFRMQEDLEDLESMFSSFFFDKQVIFLVFNKVDVFKKCLQATPLTVCFPEYRGNPTMDALDHTGALEYIQAQFFKRMDTRKRVHVCPLTAVNFENSMATFEHMMECIYNQCPEYGLL